MSMHKVFSPNLTHEDIQYYFDNRCKKDSEIADQKRFVDISVKVLQLVSASLEIIEVTRAAREVVYMDESKKSILNVGLLDDSIRNLKICLKELDEKHGA